MKIILIWLACLFVCIFSIKAQTLYGLTPYGGNDGWGALIKLIPATNSLTVANSFEGHVRHPLYTNFIQAPDGKLYSMTNYGGNHKTGGRLGLGGGAIFSFDPSTGTYTRLKDFDGANGANPHGSLMLAGNGKFYGMTFQGGTNDLGVIFSFDLFTSTYTKLKDFDFANGAHPHGSLIQASDGKLYGMTKEGGSNNYGVIFSFDPVSSTYTKLMDFIGADGGWPHGNLLQASDGKFYGMTTAGGSNGYGVIFSFDPSTSAYTKLKDFDYTNGGDPWGSLIKSSNGKLYGMTTKGGNSGTYFSYGVIFSFDPSTSTYTKLKDFDGINGGVPFGSLLQASDGKLYGMTSKSGSAGPNNDYGVIFSFDPLSSTYTKLKDFDGNNGRGPMGSLMQASDGKLYSMTTHGGSSNFGVIFSFDPSTSTYTKLKDLAATNGIDPSASLMQANNGKLYGMTTFGGISGTGVIFSFDLSTSNYTKLKDFDSTNGANPFGNLMQASDGKLYGMTSAGGSGVSSIYRGAGVLFSFDPTTSIYTKLKDFGSPSANGINPYGSLMQASNGKLYGMTSVGGNNDGQSQGIIFSYDPSNSTFSNLKDFNGADGSAPYGNLIQASDGKIYGMTPYGGSFGSGVIFSLDPSTSIFTKLKDFDVTSGYSPYGSLMQASDGKLYGMTTAGGNNGHGVIFSFEPSTSIYTKLKDFDGINGARPYGNLLQASDGKLYGMTSDGGSGGVNSLTGVIFSFDPSTSAYTKLQDFDITNGAYPYFGSALIEACDITPTVSIAITSGTNSICAGQSVIFSATPTNGGSSPSYQWKVNGNNVGTNSPTYSTNGLTNGQVISCAMTSNSACVTVNTVVSNNITVTVSPSVIPAITIKQDSCFGNSVKLSAISTNGGNSATYQWSFTGPGSALNFTTPTFTLSNSSGATLVQCKLTSNANCASPASVTSLPLTVVCTGVVSPATLNLRVHPNPANQNTIISFYLGASARISLAVFNIAGQQIAIVEDRVLNRGDQSFLLNTGKFSAGVYCIRLITVNSTITKKVVVVH